jgi:potassium efflux system protein
LASDETQNVYPINEDTRLEELTRELDSPLFSIGDTQTTVGSMLAVLIVIVVTLVLAKIARGRVNRFAGKSHGDDTTPTEAFGVAAQWLIWFIGFEFALHLLGIHISGFFAAGGALAISGGLAAKSFMEDFLSSWLLKTGKAVRPGDVIILNGRWLHIDQVGLRHITAKTGDGEEILIPNSEITKSAIQNLTRDDRLHRVQVTIGVAYDSDLAQVRATLEGVVRNTAWRVEGKKADIWLHEFARTDIVYAVGVWIDDVHQTLTRESDLREAMWRALTDAGVTIA